MTTTWHDLYTTITRHGGRHRYTDGSTRTLVVAFDEPVMIRVALRPGGALWPSRAAATNPPSRGGSPRTFGRTFALQLELEVVADPAPCLPLAPTRRRTRFVVAMSAQWSTAGSARSSSGHAPHDSTREESSMSDDLTADEVARRYRTRVR